MAEKKISKVNRIIHFYEMKSPNKGMHPIPINEVLIETFALVAKLNNQKSSHRLIKGYEAFFSIGDINYDAINKRILGKIQKIRMDQFPELMNTSNDSIKDIEAEADEGLLEVTHFLIDYKTAEPMIAIEYNQYGAKAHDLYRFIEKQALSLGYKIKINGITLVRDELNSFYNRVHRFSNFHVKVHKDNIARIESVDTGLFTALDAANEFGDSEYVEIDFKYEYKKRTNTTTIVDAFKSILSKLIMKPERKDYFEELYANAEDSDKEGKVELFDLIATKVKSRVSVQKREKSRAIISADMFEKLAQEFDSQIINPKYQ